MSHAACVSYTLASPDPSQLVSLGNFHRHFRLALLCTYYRSRDPLLCSHCKAGLSIRCSHLVFCSFEALSGQATKNWRSLWKAQATGQACLLLANSRCASRPSLSPKPYFDTSLYGPITSPSARLFFPEHRFRARRRYPVKLHKRRTEPCGSSRSYRKRTLLRWCTIRHR